MMNVFENPWLLLTLAAIALIPAAIVRQAKPEWGYLPLLVPVLLAALGFGLDYAVQTDSEKIHAIIRNCRQAAVEGRIQPLQESICDDYDDGVHRSKAQFIASAERVIHTASVSKVRFQRIGLTLEDRHASVEMDTVVHLDQDSQYAAFGSLVFVSLRLQFAKQPDDRWCISGTQVISINNQSMNWGGIR